ncbi:MAG: alpha/beta fold hydrolase [Rhodocyclaceae bacterium]|nr:alpha/beta fold hydrolase [Rhodocyclaceae bacterium]
MNKLVQTGLKLAMDRGLALNERGAAMAANGFDWVFRRSDLVKSGQTWFEVIRECDPMRVRHYDLRSDGFIDLADGSTLDVAQKQHDIPLLLVPPLGVTSDTYDLMPNRSLVRYMAARGYKVYMIDWGKPTKRHARLRLSDYADRMMSIAMDSVLEHSGARKVSLMGWCMGGLLCLMQTGLKKSDPRVANIITIASPIDIRGGGVIGGLGRALNPVAKAVRTFSDFRLQNVDPDKMHMPGWVTTLAFKLTDPVGSVTTYWDLLMRLWDREFVESYTTTSDYLNNMLPYPAGVVQDMLVTMAVDNSLARGEIPLGGKVTRFSNITAPIYVFAGASDVLVAASTTRQSLDMVKSKDTAYEVAPGGHMGVILGGKAQDAVWGKSADWLRQRSVEKRPRAKAIASKPARRKSRVAGHDDSAVVLV